MQKKFFRKFWKNIKFKKLWVLGVTSFSTEAKDILTLKNGETPAKTLENVGNKRGKFSITLSVENFGSVLGCSIRSSNGGRIYIHGKISFSSSPLWTVRSLWTSRVRQNGFLFVSHILVCVRPVDSVCQICPVFFPFSDICLIAMSSWCVRSEVRSHQSVPEYSPRVAVSIPVSLCRVRTQRIPLFSGSVRLLPCMLWLVCHVVSGT